ncbi:MAG: Gfo/Idh/MocA family oxidoreductase [Leptospirales bacterium]
MHKNSKDFRMGVIGIGRMGQYHVNVLSALNTHNLVGVYDTDIETGKKVSEQYSIINFETPEKLMEECDAVTIAVPTNLHYEMTKKALGKGCHVLIEKPITESIEQAKELIDMARATNKVLQVGHVERFNGAVIELQKIVQNPIHIETKRLSPFTPRIKDVGVVMDMLIHDLDIVINLVKSPLKSFTAVGRKIISDHEDLATITLLFESGAIATLNASRVSQLKQRVLYAMQENSYVKLDYTTQDIEIHRQASTVNLITPEEIRYSTESFVENLYVHKDNPLKSEQVHFYDCIVNNAKPLVSNDMDLETLRITLESLEMIMSNKPAYETP